MRVTIYRTAICKWLRIFKPESSWISNRIPLFKSSLLMRSLSLLAGLDKYIGSILCTSMIQDRVS